mgnify:CR=1 FL=1
MFQQLENVNEMVRVGKGGNDRTYRYPLPTKENKQ